MRDQSHPAVAAARRPGRGPRRQAWSTPKTTCPRRTTPVISKPPRSRYDSGKSASGSPVRPDRRARTAAVRRSRATAHAVGPYGADPPRSRPDDDDRGPRDRRGTQDLGLLLLRLGVGALLIAHGLQKAFGWWGGPGLDGFGDSLTDDGLPARRHPDLRGGRRPDRRRGAAGAGSVHARWRRRARWHTWSPACWRRPWRPTKRPGCRVVPHRRPRVQGHPGRAWSRRSS